MELNDMTKKKTTTTKAKTKSTWEVLSKIDCSEHVEKKGRFSYLSWAWAWGILMEHYPNATFDNHLNSDGYPCFFDANGNAMVRVTLCIDEVCHCEDFPVLNHQNKSIKNPDSFAVNTALKRCLVKCMAYFGLGHYIYAGEDLPAADKMTRESMMIIVDAYLAMNGKDGKGVVQTALDHYKKENVEELSDSELEMLVLKIAKVQKKGN
tara:strand:- start:531 stop:1154 length:624 start_codon:yes stop_codon:yes gene_type:complete